MLFLWKEIMKMIEFLKWFAIFETGVMCGFLLSCLFIGSKSDREDEMF